MKARFVLMGVAMLASVSVLACSSSDPAEPETESAESDDLDGKADGVTKPVGTYEYNGGGAGLLRIVLMTDKSFHSETKKVHPISADGTYKFTKSSTKKFIRLTTAGGVTRYEYKLTTKGALELRADGTTEWRKMSKAAEGWCKAANQCAVQGLPTPKCPGKWECDAGSTWEEPKSCSYECGPSVGCEDVGGSCVALGANPSATCPSGVVGDADDYSCGGAVGVMCCLPKLGTCAGIANIQCPAGQGCVDDPSDSCDPANAGADCSGVCVKGVPGDCRLSGCDSGKNCVQCWGSWACMPDYQTC